MIVKHKEPCNGSVVKGHAGIRTHGVLVMVKNKTWPKQERIPDKREECEMIERAL